MAANSPSSSWEKHEDDKQKQQFLPFGESEGAKRVNEDQEMKDDLQEHLQIDKIEELRRCKSWIQQQLIDCSTHLKKCRLEQEEILQPPSADVRGDIPDLNDRISYLQERLFTSSSAKSYSKVVLDRLLQGDVLMKVLFPDTTVEHPSQDDLSNMGEVAALCERNNDMCSSILEHHQELRELEQKLDKVKQKNFEIKKTNRDMMSKLQNLKERRNDEAQLSSQDDAMRQADERYKHDKSKLHLTANIFQALIVGSGINWAADDNTRELVVSLGKITS